MNTQRLGNTANYTWKVMLQEILAYGHDVHSTMNHESGQMYRPSKEIVNYHCTVDMNYPVVTNHQRKLGYKFMFAEALWILQGRDDLATIARFNKNYAQFSDDGVILAGAYGPRIIEQLPYIIKCLVKDHSSRQAVLTTWRPTPKASKDIPCTVSTQFLIRDGQLHLVHNMRSSDTWLGWPYDIFSFTMVALEVIIELKRYDIDVKLGALHFNAGSQHIYSHNLVQAGQCTLYPSSVSYEPLNSFSWTDQQSLHNWLETMRDGKNSFKSPLAELTNGL